MFSERNVFFILKPLARFPSKINDVWLNFCAFVSLLEANPQIPMIPLDLNTLAWCGLNTSIILFFTYFELWKTNKGFSADWSQFHCNLNILTLDRLPRLVFCITVAFDSKATATQITICYKPRRAEEHLWMRSILTLKQMRYSSRRPHCVPVS